MKYSFRAVTVIFLTSFWRLSSFYVKDSFWMAKNAILFCKEKLGPYRGRQVGFEWFWTTFGNRL